MGTFNLTASWVDVFPSASIFVCNEPRSIASIQMLLDEATGTPATVSVYKNPTYNDLGQAISGMPIHAGSFNANGTSGVLQTLTPTITTIAPGDWLGLAPVGTFTDSAGNITISLIYPIPVIVPVILPSADYSLSIFRLRRRGFL